jgi:hypothetical protein
VNGRVLYPEERGRGDLIGGVVGLAGQGLLALPQIDPGLAPGSVQVEFDGVSVKTLQGFAE